MFEVRRHFDMVRNYEIERYNMIKALIINNKLATLKTLVVDFNQKKPLLRDGTTLFSETIELSSPEMISYMVSQGADVNILYIPILCIAVRDKDIEKLNHLISLGVDVNKKIKDGNTALHYTITNRYLTPETAKILLDAGASPYKKNVYGVTPYQIALNERNMIPHLEVKQYFQELIEFFDNYNASRLSSNIEEPSEQDYESTISFSS